MDPCTGTNLLYQDHQRSRNIQLGRDVYCQVPSDLFSNSGTSTRKLKVLMRKQSETLESLQAQPRGSQADTSAVAIAEHCSFIDDLSSKELRCSPVLCDT